MDSDEARTLVAAEGSALSNRVADYDLVFHHSPVNHSIQYCTHSVKQHCTYFQLQVKRHLKPQNTAYDIHLAILTTSSHPTYINTTTGRNVTYTAPLINNSGLPSHSSTVSDTPPIPTARGLRTSQRAWLAQRPRRAY